LDSSRFRSRLYAVLTLLLFVAAWMTIAAKTARHHEPLDWVVSDAEGYWIYLPSVVIDGNLDFRHAAEFHATVHPMDTSTFIETPHGLRNRWPIGVALTLLPSFLLAHGVALALHTLTASSAVAPNGYSLPYQFLGIGTVLLMAWLSLVTIDGVMARRLNVRGRAIAGAVICYAVGSSWAYYIAREPFMAHGMAAAWIIFTIACAERIADAAERRQFIWWHWPLLSFTLAMAIVCRMTNGVILPVAAWAVLVAVQAGLISRMFRIAPLAILAAFPIFLQWLTLRMMPGRAAGAAGAQSMGYRSFETFHWLHPALWQTLFSNNHGLFFWSPLLLLAVGGLVWKTARSDQPGRGFVLSLLISLAALWYVNSSWYAWWFGKAFGARAFVDFSGIFIVGLGIAFEFIGALSAAQRRLAWTMVGAALAVNWVLLLLFIGKKIPREGAIWQKPGMKETL
jgi:hypothetical protein